MYSFVFSVGWFLFFFFSSRRRHTRLQGDWSSDVCSSDLFSTAAACCAGSSTARTSFLGELLAGIVPLTTTRLAPGSRVNVKSDFTSGFEEIGRASCRERV